MGVPKVSELRSETKQIVFMLPRPQDCNVEDGLSPSILPSYLIFKQSKSRIDIDIGKPLFILFHPPDLSHHAILLCSISDVHRGFV